jgi:hypothetical protein
MEETILTSAGKRQGHGQRVPRPAFKMLGDSLFCSVQPLRFNFGRRIGGEDFSKENDEKEILK